MSMSTPEEDGGTGTGGGIFADINITPLTDIFLVLLIIFMVTTTAIAEAGGQNGGIKVSLPKGGQANAVKEVHDLAIAVLSDGRVVVQGKVVDQDALKKQLVLQFCEVSGGPCRRDGPTMKEAHDGMDITRGDFNALVEVLQDAMDAQGVPFGAQNRLLARLAPMHREIINTP